MSKISLLCPNVKRKLSVTRTTRPPLRQRELQVTHLTQAHLGQFRTTSGPDQNHIWASSEPHLGQFKTTSGPVQKHIWASSKPHLGQLRTTSGPVQNHIWASSEPHLGQLRTTSGPVQSKIRVRDRLYLDPSSAVKGRYESNASTVSAPVNRRGPKTAINQALSNSPLHYHTQAPNRQAHGSHYITPNSLDCQSNTLNQLHAPARRDPF